MTAEALVGQVVYRDPEVREDDFSQLHSEYVLRMQTIHPSLPRCAIMEFFKYCKTSSVFSLG